MNTKMEFFLEKYKIWLTLQRLSMFAFAIKITEIEFEFLQTKQIKMTRTHDIQILQ